MNSAEDYPKLTNKVILDIQKENTKKARDKTKNKKGATLFNTPYLPGQNIPDEDKPRIVGKVSADFKTIGLDDGTFDWEGVFGKDSNGNPGKAKLVFKQWLNNKETGVSYELEVSKDGTYSWKDWSGEPARIPLYSKGLEPFTYSAYLDQDVSEKVKLLTYRIAGTPSGGGYEKDPETGLNVANIVIDLSIQQVTSTKFVSEWHTGLSEDIRPPVEGEFDNKIDDLPGYFPFSTKDGGSIIIRNDFVNNSDYEDPGYTEFDSSSITKTPEVKVTEGIEFVDENDEDGTPTYKLDEANKTITTVDGNHKFKYDFTYDVINGGKLTMTEIIPITFDANGGEFESITEPNADQKIKKEVEYEKDLTEEVEKPSKDLETFKGWATAADGEPLSEEEFKEAIKNVTEAKTFYAIWDNNDITAEELTVFESFKDGTGYINDFIPTLDILKGQVKMKDASGTPKDLADGDTLQILDDGDNPIVDEDALKEYLYGKLGENGVDEVYRKVTLKAKVIHPNGTSQNVDIPIKVIKNIYEAKTLEGKPSYVPDNYVKVSLDPTTKAVDPQRTVYYVNPKAKVVIPGSDPTGAGDNVFTKWLIKGTTDEYKLADNPRHMFTKDTTIEAQYEKEKQGIIKIQYVDENGDEISSDYHIEGVDYPETKEGKLADYATEVDFPKPGPDFKGYIYSSRDSIKGKHYKDPADPDNLDIVTYKYYKKVTTDTPKNPNVYFPVIFDANGGEFKPGTETQKTVYVYFDGNDATVEKVTFDEVRKAVEEAYGKPIKENDIFVEWQDKAEEGKKVEDTYEIQFKGWDWDADPDNGYVPEVFYAHYGQASAKIAYLDLDGQPIDDEFKIKGQEYPTEKGGKAGENIDKKVFTKETAPKFTGYKFNRIELNPANGKYSLDKKATIKIYYEKVPDVIPEKDGSGNKNEKPDGYVEVKFVPTDKAKDTTEKIFYVNPKKDVTIPIADPEAIPTYTFNEWKMGVNADGAVYSPSTAQKFTEPTTVITATYEETENIIPYNPSDPDPMPRPEGYVRLTFAADSGLKLTEQKAYYVKANAGITLGTIKNDTTKGYPAYTEETGYKFKEWDKADETVINADITVTAKASEFDKVIPEKDKNGNDNEKPTGYKEVTFVINEDDQDKGSINGVAKFYVKPNEYVIINPPATEANTGYEFGTWDKDTTIPTVYDKDTTITGTFNGLSDVIPKTKDDDSEKPEGYVEVNFEIEGQGGKIVDGERKTYFVNPDKEVTVPQPKTQAETGYVFDKWDEDTTIAKKYTEDTTVKGNFKKLDDIIPGTNDKGENNPKPEGYVTVTFEKGDHGKEITGKTVYYVNPKAGKTLADITKPTVSPETGWKTDGWDKEDTLEIKDNTTVTAKYSPLDDVIPKENPTGGENEKPDGYITVTFEKGANGELEGNKIFYVNPNKAVVLEDKAPTIKPNTGYTSAGWDTSINKAIQYKDGDKITALYNEKDDVIPQKDPDGKDKPAGYLTVTFDKGEHGKEIIGKTVYYVKPNKEVTVPAPTVKPETGWKQKDGDQAWDSKLTRTFTDENTTIKAQYAPLENIIPGDQTKPDGYVTVEFKAENGSLAGPTKYFVKPGVEVNLTDKADALTKKPDLGYSESGIWDKPLASKTYTEDETYTFTFEKLEDIIPATDETVKPNGYVTVKFVTNINGSLEGPTIYYVNPNAGIKMKDIKAPNIVPNQGWELKTPNWNPVYDDETPITDDKVYAANYEKLCVAEIKYISQDKEMGTVTNPSEEIGTGDLQGSTAKPNPGYEFVEWVGTDGKQVSDKEKFVPEKRISAVYIAVFRLKGTITEEVEKIWQDDVNPTPTMNFTLYRQVDGGKEEKVPDAEVIEITKAKTRASWTNLPKEDLNGKAYIYSVKEEFKDKDVKNDNWILGQMETDAKGNKTITNKLKTVPGENETPDENKHRMAKLTITKKIASNPIKKVINFFRSAVDPLEFEFKITDPYGKEETFTLKAGESKELDHLLYGEYTVEETDAKGLTPFVKVGNSEETKSSTAKVTLSKDAKEGVVEFTNKNEIPSNPNLTDIKATKIWTGGPSTDHKEVDLKLYRQVDGNEEVVKEKAQVSRDANNPSKFYYEWKNISKINDEGKEYSFRVKEANVPANYQASISDDKLTVTNTYKAPQTEALIGQKLWKDVPEGVQTPTIKLELWRKTADGKEEKVTPAKELDQNDQVNFGKQAATDEAGNKYSYFVKEVDENGNPFNDSSYTSKVDRLTVTNIKVAEVAKDGRLTITKKLENEPKRISTFTTRSANSIKFKFEVTGPDNYKEEFDLGANEYKSFEGLTHGKYFIKEIETQGYTPYFSLGDGETQTTEFEFEISRSEETKLTVINKNVVNKNDLTVRATKIWKNGPESDHTAVTLQLLRTSAKDNITEDVSNKYRLETRNGDTSDTITYVWKNLPKHDDDGYEYTYKVKELGVGEDKIYKVGNNSYRSEITKDRVNTVGETIAFDITNTYIAPEAGQDIIASKEWKDLLEGTAKPEVYFQLYRKTADSLGKPVGKAVIVENDQVNFGKQKATDKNGNPYTYYVKEVDKNGEDYTPEGFTKVEDGLKVTNTYKAQEPEEEKFVDVTAYKKWENVPAGVKKPLVKFQLKRKPNIEGGKSEPVGEPVIVEGDVDENGYIRVVFKNLEVKDKNNDKYLYFVTELDENGEELGQGQVFKANNGKDTYQVTYDKSCLYVTNTYKAGKPDITPDPDPNPGEDPKPNPEPEPNPGEDPKPNPEPEPNPGEDPKPTPEPEPNPGENPKPTPEPEPNPEPKPNPGETPEPGDKPNPNPGETPEPGDKPGPKSGETPEPGDKPNPEPGETPEPGEEPSDKPGKDPEKPGEEPSDAPGENPEKPGEKPSDKPGKESGNKQARETNKKPGKTIENTAKKVVESVEKTVKTGVDSTKSLVKKAFNPRTGIFTNLDIYLGIMAASSIGLFVTRDKKEDE